MLDSNTVSTLLGVVIGYALSLLGDWIKRKKKQRQILSDLMGELKSIRYQIAEKKRLVMTAFDKLDRTNFLDPKSIHINCMVYNNSLIDVYSEMSIIKLNCLHAIYEQIRVAEEILDNFKNDFFNNSGHSDPVLMGRSRLKDVADSYEMTTTLIDSILQNKPIDVYYLNTK